MALIQTIHPDLAIAQKLAYEPNGLHCGALIQEPESHDYGACEFKMNGHSIKFRAAKITPTKVGQFVTLWKRIGNGPIMPFDMADQIDVFVISARKDNHLGQFIFPKELLLQKGFVSKYGKGGKRAMRVYPPWDITDSSQAKKTQNWQLLYFVEIQPTMDTGKIQKLFC
ncbi:MAG: MepB family protein [Candidatus Paceibacterales bacterium]